MSNIRREFYDAINKANIQKPKKTIKKFSPKEELTLEKQIQNIIDNSDSAIIDCNVTINNQSLVDYLYEMTKKDTETLELERKVLKELEIINKLRDEARKKYNLLNRMNEFTSFNPSAASSAAAGAGGGGRLTISVDPTTNSYVVDGYVEDYLV
jgi:type II secretory pathway component GspD/PulD (secretin)